MLGLSFQVEALIFNTGIGIMAQKVSGNTSREIVIPGTVKRIRDFFGQ
jgi:hypothetical protein